MKFFSMDDEQRKNFRREIGQAIVAVQTANAHYGPDVLLPELTAALVSLAAYLAHLNLQLRPEQFNHLCDETINFEWGIDEHTTKQ